MGKDDPRHERDPVLCRIARPDGSDIRVEVRGPAGAPVVVLTPGWGATATEWFYLRRRLGDRYRVVAWDLPGTGLSRGPSTRDYGIAKFSDDLRAVLDAAGGGPAVLVGHSIGGMIVQEYCRRHPADSRGRVAGLVLIHTTATDPMRAPGRGPRAAALRRWLFVPLARLCIPLSPLIWLLTRLAYFTGGVHLLLRATLFAGSQTRGQLDFTCRYVPAVWPANYARGVLAMLRWDASDSLATIPVPVLVVAASGDRMTPPEASAAIRDACPDARLVTVAPAGHMGLIERHDEVGQAVEEFVAEVVGGRG